MVNVFSAARGLRRIVNSTPSWKMVLKAALFGGLTTVLRYNGNSWFTVILTLFLVFLVLNWKFVVIAVKTFPRDIKALRSLIELRLRMRSMRNQNKLVTDYYKELVQKHPNKIAFIYEGRTWTFCEVDEYSNRIANYFYDTGHKKDQVMAIFMESRPEFVCMWLGLAKIGVIAALINFNLRLDSLTHCIEAADAVGLVYGGELTDAVKDIKQKLKKSVRLHCIGNYRNDTISAVHLDPILQKCSPLPPPVIANRCFTDRLFYIYTSGTTGLPKAAIITHARFVYMAYGMNRCFWMNSDDIIYCPLPLYHSAGGIVGIGQTIVSGITVVIRKKFSASQFWDDCITYNCTIIQYIGEICRYLKVQPVKAVEKQHKVRMAVGNGLRPQIWEEFVTRFNIPKIAEFYGSTEGNANIVNTNNKPGAVGFNSRIAPWAYPIKLVRVNEDTGEVIRDPRTGLCIICEPGEPGELVGKVIRGDPTRDFQGYVNKQATKKKLIYDVFTHGDCAFLTGDVLVMDDEGYMYFRDRSGDTFRWRGENVSTSEVEGTISKILDSRDVVVYGVEIPGVEGRCGMAAVVDKHHTLDLVALANNLKKQLPSYARPLFIRLVESVDTTGTFKIKKTELRKESFNPNVVKDKLYFSNSKTGEYQLINAQVYSDICNGKVRL